MNDVRINEKVVFKHDFRGASPTAELLLLFQQCQRSERLRGLDLVFNFEYDSILMTIMTNVTWLILPVVICLFQRLSHASLSLRSFERNCEWLIITVITYAKIKTTRITVVILELKREPFRRSYALDSNQVAWLHLLIHNAVINRLSRVRLGF